MSRLGLIRCAPPDVPGSMSAYADLVARALALDPPPGIEVGFRDAFDPRPGIGFWRQHLWRIRNLRGVLRRDPAEIFHLLDGSMAGFLPLAARSRTWISVHDLIPLRQTRGELPGVQSPPARLLVRLGARTLARARSVCADSECTRRDLARLAGVPNAPVIPLALRPLPPPVPPAAPLPDRFALHVGHNAAYKNRPGAVAIFRRLLDLPDLHLVLAGPPPTPELRALVAGVPRIVVLENVSDAELAALYSRAAVFLFPSRFEGFGMPVLEAMALGCPVVCSNAGALPEVAGDAALTADPDDLDALAAHARAVLLDDGLRARLVAAGRRRAKEFSLERMGRQLWDWYGFSRGGPGSS